MQFTATESVAVATGVLQLTAVARALQLPLAYCSSQPPRGHCCSSHSGAGHHRSKRLCCLGLALLTKRGGLRGAAHVREAFQQLDG